MNGRHIILVILCLATLAACERKKHNYAGASSDDKPNYLEQVDPTPTPGAPAVAK